MSRPGWSSEWRDRLSRTLCGLSRGWMGALEGRSEIGCDSKKTAKSLRTVSMESFAGVQIVIDGFALSRRRAGSRTRFPFLRSSAAFAGNAGHDNALISCCVNHLGLTEQGEVRHRGQEPRWPADLRRARSAAT